jgi:hypothetical protein
MKRNELRAAMLVYQCGIANVFGVYLERDGERRTRLMQHSFGACEHFAKGIAAAGVPVSVHHCDEAGDIIGREWRSGAGDMFREGKLFTANATQVHA